MPSTVQQASAGLCPALLGAVFAETLQHSGQYINAALAGLVAEFGLMSRLPLSALAYSTKHRPPPGPTNPAFPLCTPSRRSE
jgi:hypothetical protein